MVFSRIAPIRDSVSLALHRWRLLNPKQPMIYCLQLNERAQHNDDLGMYWKIDTETTVFDKCRSKPRTSLIEAFDEIRKSQ